MSMPKEVGRQRATAIPCMARNMINWIPVRARPHASTKQARRKHAVRKIGQLPTTSATAPAVRRHEPLVKLRTRVNAVGRLVVGDFERQEHIPIDGQGPSNAISIEDVLVQTDRGSVDVAPHKLWMRYAYQ